MHCLAWGVTVCRLSHRTMSDNSCVSVTLHIEMVLRPRAYQPPAVAAAASAAFCIWTLWFTFSPELMTRNRRPASRKKKTTTT